MKNREQIECATHAMAVGSGCGQIHNWQEALGALLTNLMLWADSENINWDNALDYAKRHFEAERVPKEQKFFIETKDKDKWIRLAKSYTEKEAYHLCAAFNGGSADEPSFRVVQ